MRARLVRVKTYGRPGSSANDSTPTRAVRKPYASKDVKTTVRDMSTASDGSGRVQTITTQVDRYTL